MRIGADDDRKREQLSALADGELDAESSATLCGAWAADGALRADWHAWHLIGDVLRSDDLASAPAADRRFCAGVRARLDQEPVVLAPEPARAPARGRRLGSDSRTGRWQAGAAVAAGVVLVAGTFALLRPGQIATPVPIASGDAAGSETTAPVARTAAATPEPAPLIADSQVVRDAQLDRYLDAHKQFAGSSALGVPSVFLRSATVDSASH